MCISQCVRGGGMFVGVYRHVCLLVREGEPVRLPISARLLESPEYEREVCKG